MIRFTRRSLDAFPVRKIKREQTWIVTAEHGSTPEVARERRTCELQNLRRQVLQDRGRIDRRLRPYAHIVLRPLLQVTVYTANGELQVEV